MADQWTRRLDISLRIGGGPPRRLLERVDKAIGHFAPNVVHLRAGEMAVPVEVVHTGSPDSPLPSYHIVTCSRPGVVARICGQNTHEQVKSSGFLCDAASQILGDVDAGEDPFIQDGSTTPCFKAGGSWLNMDVTASAVGYQNIRANAEYDNVAGGFNSPGGKIISFGVPGGGLVVGSAKYIAGWSALGGDWTGSSGRYGNWNLGERKDGKILQFWLQPGSGAGITPDSVKVYFSSYHSLAIGITEDVNDLSLVEDTPKAPYFWCDITSRMDFAAPTNYWTPIRLEKRDFSETLGFANIVPEWNSISSYMIYLDYTTEGVGIRTYGHSGLWFGDPPESYVWPVTILSAQHANPPVIISLDAPANEDADVHVFSTVKL